MRKALRPFALCVLLLSFAGCPRPPGTVKPLLLLAVTAVAAQEGVDVPAAVLQQVLAISDGDPNKLKPVDMATLKPEDRVISPVTGKPCMFITKKGLTPVGVLAVKAIMEAGDG